MITLAYKCHMAMASEELNGKQKCKNRFWISDNFSISKEGKINFIQLNSHGLFKHIGYQLVVAIDFSISWKELTFFK